MATNSSILAWEFPLTEETGGLWVSEELEMTELLNDNSIE